MGNTVNDSKGLLRNLVKILKNKNKQSSPSRKSDKPNYFGRRECKSTTELLDS